MRKKRIVIIGAGPAGLSAAYKLLKNNRNYRVIIVDEDKQVGGISKTINYKGYRMDLGGHRFFSKNKEVNDFWQEILPMQGAPASDEIALNETKEYVLGGPNPEEEDRVALTRRRISRIYYNKKFFDYPVSLKYSTLKNMGIGTTFNVGIDYLKSCAVKKPEDNLENFYINRFGEKLYSMFFEDYTEKLWGRHPSQIDAQWGSQRVKGISISAILKDMLKINKEKETSLIEEFMYPKFGPGQMWEEVAQKIIDMGGEIYLNCKVEKIIKEKNRVSCLECMYSGQSLTLKGDVFISSMPLKDLVENMSQTPLDIFEIAEKLPYRDFVTMGILVDKLKIKNQTKLKTINDIVPDCWIYVQEPDVKLGRIQIFNNWSPYLVPDKDKVWIGLEYFCNENDDFWNLTEEEMLQFVSEELIKMQLIDKKEDILDSHREKVKKAYPAYFDSYNQIDKVIDYINKIDNLYCVGRNGQHRYNNMDHSMLTGFYCAEEILNNTNNKQRIWAVNTEKEYHETK